MFRKGEVLTYLDVQYSRYDTAWTYEFAAQDGTSKWFLLGERESAKAWRSLFRPAGLLSWTG